MPTSLKIRIVALCLLMACGIVAYQNFALLPGSHLFLSLNFDDGYRLGDFLSPLRKSTEIENKVTWPRLFVPPHVSHLAAHDFTIAENTNYRVWISDVEFAGQTGRSLGITVYPQAQEAVADKVVLHAFRHSDDGRIDFSRGGQRYVSFKMKFGRDYEIPNLCHRGTYTLHMQAWQQNTLSHPPPFAMYVQPVVEEEKKTNRIELVFVVRDDRSIASRLTLPPIAKREAKEASIRDFVSDCGNRSLASWSPQDRSPILFRDGRVVGRVSLERDKWYQMIFQLRPSANGDGREGQAAVWLDSERVVSYQGDWGYSPGNGTQTSIGVNIGTYRSRQERLQTVFFDDIKAGGNWEHHSGLPAIGRNIVEGLGGE